MAKQKSPKSNQGNKEVKHVNLNIQKRKGAESTRGSRTGARPKK